jgi:hypothetical protein
MAVTVGVVTVILSMVGANQEATYYVVVPAGPIDIGVAATHGPLDIACDHRPAQIGFAAPPRVIIPIRPGEAVGG